MHMSEVFEMPDASAEAAAVGGEEGADEDKKKGGKNLKKSVPSEVNNGDEVSFNVIESKQDGRMNAVRVLKLPKGSVSFETVLPGRVQGTISRLPPAANSAANKKVKDRDLAFKGLIAPLASIVTPNADGTMPPLIEESEGGEAKTKGVSKGGKFVDPDAGMVTWTISDLSTFALVLEMGDTIEFTAVLDKPTKKLRAEKVPCPTYAQYALKLWALSALPPASL